MAGEQYPFLQTSGLAQPQSFNPMAYAGEQALQWQGLKALPAVLRAQRTQQMLQNLQQTGGQNLRSPIALGANLLAEALLSGSAKQATQTLADQGAGGMSDFTDTQDKQGADIVAAQGGQGGVDNATAAAAVRGDQTPPSQPSIAAPNIPINPLGTQTPQDIKSGVLTTEQEYGPNRTPQDAAAQKAVADAIVNRVGSSGGRDITSIVNQPGQFEVRRPVAQPGSPDYERTRANVFATLMGLTPDSTHGSTDFYSPSGMAAVHGGRTPGFAQNEPAIPIGGNNFIPGASWPGQVSPVPQRAIPSLPPPQLAQAATAAGAPTAATAPGGPPGGAAGQGTGVQAGVTPPPVQGGPGASGAGAPVYHPIPRAPFDQQQFKAYGDIARNPNVPMQMRQNAIMERQQMILASQGPEPTPEGARWQGYADKNGIWGWVPQVQGHEVDSGVPYEHEFITAQGQHQYSMDPSYDPKTNTVMTANGRMPVPPALGPAPSGLPGQGGGAAGQGAGAQGTQGAGGLQMPDRGQYPLAWTQGQMSVKDSKDFKAGVASDPVVQSAVDTSELRARVLAALEHPDPQSAAAIQELFTKLNTGGVARAQLVKLAQAGYSPLDQINNLISIAKGSGPLNPQLIGNYQRMMDKWDQIARADAQNRIDTVYKPDWVKAWGNRPEELDAMMPFTGAGSGAAPAGAGQRGQPAQAGAPVSGAVQGGGGQPSAQPAQPPMPAAIKRDHPDAKYSAARGVWYVTRGGQSFEVRP